MSWDADGSDERKPCWEGRLLARVLGAKAGPAHGARVADRAETYQCRLRRHLA